MGRPTRAILLFAGIAAAGCAETPMPAAAPPARTAPAPIRTDRTSYAFRHGFFGPETAIVATLHAPADKTLYIVNCNGAISSGLQRLTGGAWIDAWAAITNSCLSQPIVIRPGETHTDTIALRPGVGAALPPLEHEQLIEPGTYRVAWHGVLTSFDFKTRPWGDQVPIEQRASAPFTIEAPPPRPAAIASFAPPDEARVAATARVRVTFDGSGLRLFVDGADVTARATRTGSEISFAPAGGWPAGRHGVKIELADGSEYSWVFTVEGK